MAAAMPDIFDHVRDLLENKISTVNRNVPSSRFTHVEFDVTRTLSNAAGAPYPFNVTGVGGGENQPFDVPGTISASHTWHGFDLLIRVAYNVYPHRVFSLEKIIMDDTYVIRRCLEDPDSWVTLTTEARATANDASYDYVDIPGGSETDDEQTMLMLEIPVSVSFREDQS